MGAREQENLSVADGVCTAKPLKYYNQLHSTVFLQKEKGTNKKGEKNGRNKKTFSDVRQKIENDLRRIGRVHGINTNGKKETTRWPTKEEYGNNEQCVNKAITLRILKGK